MWRETCSIYGYSATMWRTGSATAGSSHSICFPGSSPPQRKFSFDPSSPVPMIGASGAVSGILGAYLLLFPRAKVKTLIFILVFITTVDIPAMLLLTIWFFMQIAFSQGEGWPGSPTWAALCSGCSS